MKTPTLKGVATCGLVIFIILYSNSIIFDVVLVACYYASMYFFRDYYFKRIEYKTEKFDDIINDEKYKVKDQWGK